MKKVILLILLIVGAFQGFSQTPGINYQAVILDPNVQELPGANAEANILANNKVVVQFTIIDELNDMEFQEYHETSTDAYGMINLIIGHGTVISSNGFMDVAWEGLSKKLKVEIDFTGRGNNFTSLSEQDLTYMPQPVVGRYAQDIIDNTAAIITERNRALAAEVAIQADVNENEVDADIAIQANTNALAAEVARATNSEAANASDIATEKTRAEAAEITNSTAIVTEKSRAETVEAGLQSAIGQNKAEADAAILANSDALESEVNRATNAEGTNTAAIATEKSRAEAAEAANTLAIGTNATDISTANNAIGNNASAIATEKSRAEAAEAANTLAIGTNATDISNANNAIGNNTTAIATEKSRAEAAEAANTLAIGTNATDISTANTVIGNNTTAIATEKSRAEAAEAVNTLAIGANVTDILNANTIIGNNTTAINTKAAIAGQVFTGAILATNLSGANTGDQDLSSYATNTNLALKADIASPTFTGTPTLPTGTIATNQTAGDNSTAIATTAFVSDAVNTATSGNFVDLTTNQTVAGSKIFSDDFTINGDLKTGGSVAIGGLSYFPSPLSNKSTLDIVSDPNGDLITGFLPGIPGDRFNIKLDKDFEIAAIKSGGGYDLKLYSESGTMLFEGETMMGTPNFIFNGNLEGSSFVKTGGTSSQFLKADGSIDATSYASLASPTFTGIPVAPTATAGTNTTQIATTAFVKSAVSTATTGNFVDLNTNQTIAGTKTFSSQIIAPGINSSGNIAVNGLKIGTPGGNQNTMIGIAPFTWAGSVGNNNTVLGNFAFTSSSGNSNTAIGSNAIRQGAGGSGDNNTAVGESALSNGQAGNKNTAIGVQTLVGTTGSDNVSVGYVAGKIVTTGIQNTFIGSKADAQTGQATITNSIAIGYNAKVAADNTIQLGNGSVTDVITSGKITTGAITLPNTDGAANQVLQTNGSGVLSWVTALNHEDGSNITSINADNISSGTLNNARLPSSISVSSIAADGSAITNLSANQISSGSFSNARISSSNVTQHQAALSISESQIGDLSHTVNTDDQTAQEVVVTPTGNLVATTVQAALVELQDEVSTAQTDADNNSTAIALKANIDTPTFTGIPAAPTATAGTNTTQLATTAFVATANASLQASIDNNKALTDASIASLQSATTAANNSNFSTTIIIMINNGLTNFTNVNLSNVDFSGLDLTGIDMTGSTLIGITSGNVSGTPTLPVGYSLISGFIVGPGVKLTNADLTSQDLSNIDLTGADLTGADLANANLTGATLPREFANVKKIISTKSIGGHQTLKAIHFMVSPNGGTPFDAATTTLATASTTDTGHQGAPSRQVINLLQNKSDVSSTYTYNGGAATIATIVLNTAYHIDVINELVISGWAQYGGNYYGRIADTNFDFYTENNVLIYSYTTPSVFKDGDNKLVVHKIVGLGGATDNSIWTPNISGHFSAAGYGAGYYVNEQTLTPNAVFNISN